MTREEAITVLEGLSDNPLFSNQHKAAFNIAIHDIKQRHDWDINNLILVNKDDYEPLEQEPCEDAVSRKAVITIIQNHWWNCRDIDKLVNELPSVTPIRPKGHWMGDSYGYICSNCEHSLNDLAQSMDYISFSKPKFCPNCGADMREVEE